MRRAFLRLAPLVLILVASPKAHSQLVHGRVTDGVSGAPVSGASVMLIDRYQAIRVSGRTEADGTFRLLTIPGRYLLQVAATGYRTVGSKEVRALQTDTLDFEIRLPPMPVDLAEVTVTGRRRGVPDPSGFYRRMEIETGRFVGPEDIEAIHPSRVPDLLRAVPGFTFHPTVGGELLWVISRGRGCTPTVYLDGGLARRGSTTNRGNPGYREESGLLLDEIVNPAQLGALEVYQDGTDSPARFRPVGEVGGGDCAVVVLWTRAALGTKDGGPIRND